MERPAEPDWSERSWIRSELSHVTFLPVRIAIRAEESISLAPYKGGTLRGGLGQAYRRVVCTAPDAACRQCLVGGACSFPYLFDTPVPDDSARMRKYPVAPLPFILVPPPEQRIMYDRGEVLSLDLCMIGRAADALPYFVRALEVLGQDLGLGHRHGKFTVERVEFVPPDPSQHRVLYDGTKPRLDAGCRLLSLEDLTCGLAGEPGSGGPAYGESSSADLAIRFLTPTRIVGRGRLAEVPEFHLVVRSLLRRVSNLAYFHCGRELQLDYAGLIREAEVVRMVGNEIEWFDWTRYSTRQQTTLEMGGVVGRVVYRGDLSRFGDLLCLGEVVHVGKGTSFGLGRYRVEGAK